MMVSLEFVPWPLTETAAPPDEPEEPVPVSLTVLFAKVESVMVRLCSAPRLAVTAPMMG